MLIHSFGLRAHDEAEEVLVGDGRSPDRGRGRGAALVVQAGTLGEQKFDILVWGGKSAGQSSNDVVVVNGH